MMLSSKRCGLHLALIVPLLSRVSAYTWPSPQYDALEEILYEGVVKAGSNTAQLAGACTSRVFQGGPSVGAEWLRLAYHDMATHNVTDGTGGLDASIFYELSRAENVGAGMIKSVVDFRFSNNKYVSRADIIAMGAVWGVATCGGPPIRFRGGRIDASGPGRPGVPEPQQDLQSHTESFRLQGFTPTEMIGLVACGHTMGAVRAVDFPTIVADQHEVDPSVGFFDSTQRYDNLVVTEYLQSTTNNPLVVNANTTVLSDLRIFSSDENATMTSMQTPDAFVSRCQNLLERMIDTVPANVQLTDEIILLPFKVKTAELIINGSDVVFHVMARIARPGALNTSPTPTVQLFWCDRAGPSADCADGTANFATAAANLLPGELSPLTQVALNTSFQPYVFRAKINSDASVGKFWFGVRDVGQDVQDTMLQANGGLGYLIDQDVVISAVDLNTVVNPTKFGDQPVYTMGIGIKSTSTSILAEMRVYDGGISVLSLANDSIPPAPLNVSVTLQPLSTRAAVGGYTFYTGTFNDTVGHPSVDFAVGVDGKQYELDFVQGPLFSPIPDGDTGAFSEVGKMTLVDALFGGEVDTKVEYEGGRELRSIFDVGQ